MPCAPSKMSPLSTAVQLNTVFETWHLLSFTEAVAFFSTSVETCFCNCNLSAINTCVIS